MDSIDTLDVDTQLEEHKTKVLLLRQDRQALLGFPYDDFNLYPYGFPAPTL